MSHRVLRMTAALAGVALAALLVVGPASVRASDPPHWFGADITSTEINCTNGCHHLHQAEGGTLTRAAGNVNLCQSCHNPTSTLAGGFPVNNADKAVPGSTGTSHAFDAAAVNAGFETQVPLNAQMAVRVMGGQVVCSTCHDQHSGRAAFGGASRVRPAKQVTALGSTGALAPGGTFTGAQGVWYLVEITQAGTETTSKFRYSKDNGISWFPVQNAGSNVPLDSGVTVTFGAGSYVLGERWEFAGAWPFLRAALDSGANGGGSDFCRDCHRSRAMDHTAVETYTGAYRSHPVGVPLNANGQGYDRPAPLDGNGAAQGGAGIDGNRTNDLLFDASGRVQCLTCHAVHYVDSNTQTVDQP